MKKKKNNQLVQYSGSVLHQHSGLTTWKLAKQHVKGAGWWPYTTNNNTEQVRLIILYYRFITDEVDVKKQIFHGIENEIMHSIFGFNICFCGYCGYWAK